MLQHTSPSPRFRWIRTRLHLVFFPSPFRHHRVPIPLLSINCDHSWSLITRIIQSSETKQTHWINLHLGQWPYLSETAAQPVFFGPKSPSPLSDFIWRREKEFPCFKGSPFKRLGWKVTTAMQWQIVLHVLPWKRSKASEAQIWHQQPWVWWYSHKSCTKTSK